MSPVELVPASERTLADLAALFTRSFEAYVIPIAMTPEMLAAMVRFDGSDLTLSRVVRVDGDDVGVVLLGRRGATVRVAAMGLVAAARGRRLGGEALEQLVPELRDAHVETLLLEVIGENAPAVRLYERLGFAVRRRLVGFARAEAPPGDPQAAVEEIDPFDAVDFLARHGERRLPWQLQPASLWALGWPTRGFALGERGVALVTPSASGVAVRGICVREADRRQGAGRLLVAGVAAQLDPLPWNVPPIVPEGLADGFFGALGFGPARIFQHEMALAL